MACGWALSVSPLPNPLRMSSCPCQCRPRATLAAACWKCLSFIWKLKLMAGAARWGCPRCLGEHHPCGLCEEPLQHIPRLNPSGGADPPCPCCCPLSQGGELGWGAAIKCTTLRVTAGVHCRGHPPPSWQPGLLTAEFQNRNLENAASFASVCAIIVVLLGTEGLMQINHKKLQSYKIKKESTSLKAYNASPFLVIIQGTF